jgi:predicted transcriptional regulator
MEVYISIKPEYTKLIETKEKNYEFRKYLIKEVKVMYVYESVTSCLKYIMEVDIPVSFPNKIEENGIGNIEFNQGDDYQYAYPIKHLYKLNKPITLTELRSKYHFEAPQKYTYASKYPELYKRIQKEATTQIY